MVSLVNAVYQAFQVCGQYFESFFKLILILGVNGLPGPAGLRGQKGERGIFDYIYLKIKYMTIVLGGTAPGYWGETGVPGIRGRSGGKYLDKNCSFIYLFFFLLSSWKSWWSR